VVLPTSESRANTCSESHVSHRTDWRCGKHVAFRFSPPIRRRGERTFLPIAGRVSTQVAPVVGHHDRSTTPACATLEASATRCVAWGLHMQIGANSEPYDLTGQTARQPAKALMRSMITSRARATSSVSLKEIGLWLPFETDA
jgi:hypothetical protein